MEQLRDAVHGLAWRLDVSRFTSCGGRYITDAVLWVRLGFRLRFERMAGGTMRSLEWQIRRRWLRTSKLGTTTNLHIVGGNPRLGGLEWAPWYNRVMADRLATSGGVLPQVGVLQHLARAPGGCDRAQTRFGGLVSVFESPAVANPRWLARTKNGLRAGGTFIGPMAVWMSERDIRLTGPAVGADRVCPLDGSLAELMNGAPRLKS